MAEARSLKIIAGAIFVARRCIKEKIKTDRFLDFAMEACAEQGVADELMQRLIVGLGYEFLRDMTINRGALEKIAEQFDFLLDPTAPEGAAN